MSSLGHFLASARTEVARYGDDDDVFVRELVQNARDAFAKRISFTRKDLADGVEVVTVDDDGVGMSRAVVTGALLRLFSSKKDQEEGAAGCFGVGFWSVLRFADVDVVVDTSDGREHSALRIDLINETLVEEKSFRTGPAQKGTQVTLRRRRREQPFALKAAILGHAAHVTGKRGPPPRLELGHEVLNRNLKLGDDVLCSRTIEGNGFRGIVGLSPSPRIELLHHGLRVVEASSLLALVPSKKTTTPRGLGLSAQIDVDSLSVLVDRKTVVEDDRLRAVVDACDAAAKKLEREALDEAAPLPLRDAALQWLLRLVRSTALRITAVALVTVVLGAVCGFGVLWFLRPDLRDRIPVKSPLALFASSSSKPSSALFASPAAPPAARPLDHALQGFDAPRIDVRGAQNGGWDVDVDGVGTGQLRLFVLPLPDDRKGLTTRPLRTRSSTPPPSAPTHARLALRVAAAGPLILPSSPPSAAGAGFWPIAVNDDGRRSPVVLVNDDGLPVFVASGPGVLTVELTATATAPSTVPLPTPASSTSLSELTAPALAADAGLRKELLVAAVQQRVRYAADAESAAAFDRDRRPFIDKALALGRGDCDVINTVLVRALLAAGYEARLAVGLIVVDDNVAYDLHAWAEVKDDQSGAWMTLDASPADARPKPVPTASTTPAATTTTTKRDLPNRLFIAGIALAIAVLSAGFVVVLLLQRRRRVRPRPHVLPLFLAGLQSGAADRLGLRKRPFLPTLDGKLLSLDDASRLFAGGRLTRAARRPPWLHPRVRVLDVDDERVRALRPWLPRLIDADEVVFDDTANAQGRLRPLQDAIDRVFAGVHVRAGDVDDVIELHLRTRTGATHLVVVSRLLLAADDATLEARVRDATCLRGLP